MKTPKLTIIFLAAVGGLALPAGCSEPEDPELIAFRPGPHACSVCGFESSASGSLVWIALDEHYLGIGVDAVDVVLFDDQGARAVFELGDLPLTEDKTVVSLPPAEVPDPVVRGTVTIYFSDGQISEDPLDIA